MLTWHTELIISLETRHFNQKINTFGVQPGLGLSAAVRTSVCVDAVVNNGVLYQKNYPHCSEALLATPPQGDASLAHPG